MRVQRALVCEMWIAGEKSLTDIFFARKKKHMSLNLDLDFDLSVAPHVIGELHSQARGNIALVLKDYLRRDFSAEFSSQDMFHAGVCVQNHRPDYKFKSLRYDRVLVDFATERLNFVAERYLPRQPVRFFVSTEIDSTSESFDEQDYINRVLQYIRIKTGFDQQLLILECKRPRNALCRPGVFEYRFIWENVSFESALHIREFLKKKEFDFRSIGADANAYLKSSQLIAPGCVDRNEWEFKSESGALNKSIYNGITPPTFVPRGFPDRNVPLRQFKLFFVTFVPHGARQIDVDLQVNVNDLVDADNPNDLVAAALHHVRELNPDAEINGDVETRDGRIMIKFKNPHQGMRCPSMSHRGRNIICSIDSNGVGSFVCTHRNDGVEMDNDECPCDDLVGLTPDASIQFCWIETFKALRAHNACRIDTPISAIHYGGCDIYPPDFWAGSKLELNRFGFHPPHSDAFWSYKFMDFLFNDQDYDGMVHYVNLFVVHHMDGSFYCRTLHNDAPKKINDKAMRSIMASLIFMLPSDANDRASKKKRMKFFDYWMESRLHAVSTQLVTAPFVKNVMSFVPKVVNILSPKHLDLWESLAAFDKVKSLPEGSFLSQFHEALLHVITGNSEGGNTTKHQNLIEEWMLRILFEFGKAQKVAFVLDSSEGGTGKSSFFKILLVLLGQQHVFARGLEFMLKEKFNSEFNKPLCLCDDSAKLTPQKKEELDERVKEFITADYAQGGEKFGSNLISQLKISNLVIGANKARLAGINSVGFERRFIIAKPLSLEEQDEYFGSDELNPLICRFSCAERGVKCGHVAKNQSDFMCLLHDTICGDLLKEYYGFLYRKFAFSLCDPSRKSLAEMIEHSVLVEEQQLLQQSPLERWYGQMVQRHHIIDLRDKSWHNKEMWLVPKINLRNVNANDLSDSWIPILPFDIIFDQFNHTFPQLRQNKVHFQDDLRQFIRTLHEDRNYVFEQAVECNIWRCVPQEQGGRTEWVWKKANITKTLVCFHIPCRLAPRPVRKQRTIGTFTRSESNFGPISAENSLFMEESQPEANIFNVRARTPPPILQQDDPDDGEVLEDEENSAANDEGYASDGGFVCDDEDEEDSDSRKRTRDEECEPSRAAFKHARQGGDIDLQLFDEDAQHGGE